MELSSGVYTIQNAHNRNWAVLVNDDDGDDVISGTDADENAGRKWNIRRLQNGTYLVRNERFQNHATYKVTDGLDDLSSVLSARTGSPRHWRIKYSDGFYSISDLDGARCWSLNHDLPHTSISLEKYTHSNRKRWRITPASENHSFQPPGNHMFQSSIKLRLGLRECPPPSLAFTGRHDILKKMHEYFSTRIGKRHVFVLYGLGGTGKSQILFKFVEESQFDKKPSRFSEVFFIDATSAETIETELRNICIAKGAGDSAAEMLRWLARKNEEWLLVFDSADDISVNLRDYFPICYHGNIVVTSRNSQTRIHAPSSQAHSWVPSLAPEEAKDLLLEISGMRGEGESDVLGKIAMEIVKQLGNLALAIVQAGAYICQSGCGLAQYLEMYGERRAMFLEEYRNHVQKIDDYEWTVYTTWTVSFEKLSTQAVTLLNICAFFHHDGLSAAIFQKAFSNITTRVLYDSQGSVGLEIAKKFLASFQTANHTWDPHKFLTVMTEIRSYSLIDFDEKNNIYSIHPLVHAWTRNRVSDVATIHECSQYILGMSIDWRFESEDMTFRRMLLPHINQSLQGCSVSDMATWLSLPFDEGGQWTKASKLNMEALAMTKRILGDEHLSTLTCMFNLASTYRSQGRWKEAEELEVKVMETRRRVLGDEDPRTLRVMANLALTYWDQGRLSEAEALGVKVTEMRKRVLGDEHPDTLTVITNLARTYLDQGRLKEAEELGEKAMEVRVRVLGERHPDTLTSMNNLAYTYQNQHRWKVAEELHVKVTEMSKQVSGDEHPRTLTSMTNLASTYRNQNRCKEAEELEVKVVEARKRVLSEEHHETLTVMSNLSLTYLYQGRTKEAEKLGVKVMETRKRVLGDEHPHTLASMNNVARTYQSQCRWKEAEELGVKAMELRIRVLGDEHPHTLASMSNVALTYQSQRRWKEAEELGVKVMETSKRVLGEDHPETLTIMANLASVYRNQGRWRDVKELEMKVKVIKERVLGEEHGQPGDGQGIGFGRVDEKPP